MSDLPARGAGRSAAGHRSHLARLRRAADFDQEFRSVMAEATSTMDLTVLAAFVERWRRVAWSVSEGDQVIRKTVTEPTRPSRSSCLRTSSIVTGFLVRESTIC